jgi:hypothetical protein
MIKKTVDEQDYILWKEDRVTKFFVNFVEQMLEDVAKQRLNRNYITNQEGLLKLNYFLGYNDALEDLMNIFESEIDKQEVKNEES